jgi:alcohol dehydrogenase class IV
MSKMEIKIGTTMVPGVAFSNAELGWQDMPAETTGMFYAGFGKHGTTFAMLLPATAERVAKLAAKLRGAARFARTLGAIGR